jgi:hypothetical protein
MKKGLVIGFAALVTAGSVMAQDDVVMVGDMGGSSSSAALFTAEAALVSSHVWRGQVLNNDFVIQPQLTASQYGVSLNIWGNFDLGKNYLGVQGNLSEVDVTLAYTLPINVNEIAIDVGIIGYSYPANGDFIDPIGINKKSTTELYAGATVLSFQQYVIPSVTLFGDVNEADGVYILFDVVAPYQISEYLSVEGGISAGWGNTSYNDYYWGGNQDAGWNDYNFYGNLRYEILDNLTGYANLTYTLVEGGSLSDAASAIYESDQKFWGGVNIAYDF